MSFNSKGGKAAIAASAAIGSAAIAGALLFATSRRRSNPQQPGPVPSGEKPETD